MPIADPTQQNTEKVFRRSDLENLHYVDTDNVSHIYPVMGQGPARLANAAELAKDELGFTNPNLHRRIDPHDPPVAENPLDQEVAPRDYKLQIQNVHSYRTTQINVHDEESTYSEIP